MSTIETTRPSCASTSGLRANVATNGVKHDVDSAAFRFPHDSADVVFLLVVDDDVRADLDRDNGKVVTMGADMTPLFPAKSTR